MNLRGKVAVVTGASSGIGAAIARELSISGAHLVVTARRQDRLQALCASFDGECVAHIAAIGDVSTPQALLDLALQRYGRVDILINNAGMLVTGTLDTMDLEALAQMTRTNYDAVVRASYIFARHFKQQSSGAIINVSSIGAYLSHSSMGVYAGLKQALEVFTTSLRVELKGSGVRVGSIAPGTTDTEIFNPGGAQGTGARFPPTAPLEPTDIATAVRFMLEQPERVNVARILLVSSEESA